MPVFRSIISTYKPKFVAGVKVASGSVGLAVRINLALADGCGVSGGALEVQDTAVTASHASKMDGKSFETFCLSIERLDTNCDLG